MKIPEGFKFLTYKMCQLLKKNAKIYILKIWNAQFRYNITSWMKAFIDRLYCFYNFQNTRPRTWSSQLASQNRKAVLVAICEQENVKDMGFTLEAMRIPIEALGYQVIGEQAIFKAFDKGKVQEDSESLEKAFTLGTDLAKVLI
ncbi:MAG: hypothetical protein KGY61_13890 [Desulfobacterales bacterium]|nr:hypothetical protein [Desulfobacterales bacterium]